MQREEVYFRLLERAIQGRPSAGGPTLRVVQFLRSFRASGQSQDEERDETKCADNEEESKHGGKGG